jgi:integrase
MSWSIWTENADVTHYLTPTLKRELQRIRSLNGVTRIQGLVFHRDGEKLNHTYREVQRLCQEQRIPDFLFHDLRHVR